MLTNDPGMGVIRHVDAGYDRAAEVAAERGVRVPMAEAERLTSAPTTGGRAGRCRRRSRTASAGCGAACSPSAACDATRRLPPVRLDGGRRDCRAWFAGQAGDRGLAYETDRNGNQWAWLGDPDGGRRRGDRLPPGLRARRRRRTTARWASCRAFAALDALRARGLRPGRPLGVVELHRRGGRPLRPRLRWARG